MKSLAIPPCSSLSLSNVHQQSPRVCLIFRNPRSNFKFLGESRGSCLRCNCGSKGTGGTGENENRSVLDAFFLGKALAEVINERIESTVGEVLGTIGRFQAEQQKQIQDIQVAAAVKPLNNHEFCKEEVLERAKRSKERAARETVETQGLVASKPPTINPKPPLTPTSTNALSDENLSAFSGSSTPSSSSDEDNV